MNRRHEQILNIISSEKEISVNSLSDMLNVSLVTIRSDLRLLEEQKLLMRTHGGACLPSTDDIGHRLSINYSAKQKIARAAAALVEEGDTILLEAGSSVALLAQLLSSRKNINVLTNNAFVARQFKDSPGVNVILMGGMYQKESETMVGPMVRDYLSYYNFTKVFMGIDGFTKDQGAMCRDLDRADVMSSFVQKGKKIYILTDSGKLGKSEVKTICRPEEINYIISDSGVSKDFCEFFQNCGIELIKT